ESGLDIPNANTLIVNDSDMFGLSQLYQLRGRVGRSERQAFAYFTFRKDHEINDIAKKRLIAIRDFTELGSGFKIAMRDLELRGAGNILGAEQHGHIAAVGFDLYCKLLAEEMEKARGIEKPAAEVSTQIDLDVNAYIPDSFVPDSVLKVEFYKRLAACTSLSEIDDLSAELSDRYGPLPAQVENMLDIGRIRVPARRLMVESIKQKPGGVVELKFAADHPVRGEHLLELMIKWEKRLLFSDKKGLSVMVRTGDIRSDAGREGLILRILCELEKAVFPKGD
ncbi:MAG: transcription-repair coupling factor, partial [Firmicutes bacterium]|nr:transcription-repair coupling factor [Bacillota bacterium]